MLRLGAEASDGIITALMPPAHIARLRAELGPNKLLLAQQMVMLEGDADSGALKTRTVPARTRPP